MSDLPKDPASASADRYPPGPALGPLLGASGGQAVSLVRAVPDDALAAATPCADYDVRALVNHLFQVVTQFRELALKKPSDFGDTPDVVGTDGHWRDSFAAAVDELVRVWSAPGAEEGTTGAMDMPARTVGCLVLLDLTVHAWDLARATGREYRPDPGGAGVVPVLATAVTGLAPTARRMGMFAEPLPVREDAPDFERLLAVTGRDPGWTRP
ncbi:TIGR03086 family metal-binding protein [Streptomyces uncialis]|uniref:TIGR03086 family metal-binding protein n=1 Tax=Streptomyces uncialis TaxID=1048205 RepID=UPI0022587142|nr:TIGR03086 family metal-binding protein [Streptomyces uncialis]MCX4664529.1 TIGR03086 family metal-binding protein [Streptomyces uncialis]